MESWEQIFWSASPAFPVSILRPATEYVLTDFRIIIRHRGMIVQELALDDIAAVRLRQTWSQRLSGTSTVQVLSRRDDSALTLSNIRHGPQLALILQLRGAGLGSAAEFIRDALRPDAPPLLRPHRGLVFAATVTFAATFGVIGLARHDPLPAVVFASDDPIAPNGERRTTAQIVEFMERQVMPFARRVLAPLEGGAENVTCETCHGSDAAARAWKMPGVRALPEPELRLAGMERSGLWLDPQVRNAVYGYLAEEENQLTASYMRRVVMPGMAELLRRPAYDFARSYGDNRAHAAVGCYHCHLVE